MLHISLAAEKIGNLWGLPVTNSLLTTWITMVVLFVFVFLATRKMSIVPGALQNIAEAVVGGLYTFFSDVTGHNTKKFFPLIASLFLFILFSNWLGLLPGVGSIGIRHEEHKAEAVTPVAADTKTVDSHGEPIVAHDDAAAAVAQEEHAPAFTPIFRAGTADLNLTFALAIIAVVAIQLFGFVALKLGYIGKFLSFQSPISFALGIMELISEISRILSFAFRLFGNIFAGEVLLAVMAFLVPFIIPLPFLAMEIFVGLIQAIVFSMLTAVFLNMAVTAHEESH